MKHVSFHYNVTLAAFGVICFPAEGQSSGVIFQLCSIFYSILDKSDILQLY
jgi:hypothetical protein